MLVNGKWTQDWQPVQAIDAKGGFVRQVSSFRNWVTPDGSAGPTGQGGFAAAKGRYHLYVAYICPWASRTLIARKLKKLEDVVSFSVVEPVLSDEGWRFGDYPGSNRDDLNGATYLHELYSRAEPTFTGRATVPVLWDRERKTIVNNESADIVRMLNSGFGALSDESVDLYPEALRGEIDGLNERIYPALNNGVYRAGFATTQVAYEEAYQGVFAMLDELEAGPTAATGASENALARRRTLLQKLITAESMHEAVEEEYFWPTVREHVPDGDALADHAIVQEQSGKQELDDLIAVHPLQDRFEGLLSDFIAGAREHIDFEEMAVVETA